MLEKIDETIEFIYDAIKKENIYFSSYEHLVFLLSYKHQGIASVLLKQEGKYLYNALCKYARKHPKSTPNPHLHTTPPNHP